MQQCLTMDDIRQVLLEERDALLTGRIDLLEGLAIRKDYAWSWLENQDIAPTELTKLAELSSRNEVLLRTTIDAIEHTMALLLHGSKGFDSWSYSADGTRNKLEVRVGRLAHRA